MGMFGTASNIFLKFFKIIAKEIAEINVTDFCLLHMLYLHQIDFFKIRVTMTIMHDELIYRSS